MDGETAVMSILMAILIGMVCVLGYVMFSVSTDINTVTIEVTQVKTRNFQELTTIYDHGGSSLTFWGIGHPLEAGHIYLITYRSGFIHPTIIKIEEL